MIRTGKWASIIFLLCILLAGCGKEKEPIQAEEDTQKTIVSKEAQDGGEAKEQKDGQELLEIEVTEEPQNAWETDEVYKGNLDVPIDYDFLAKEHEILEYNICTSPASVFDHPILREFLKEDLEFEEDIIKEFNAPVAENDYFVFDFNGDGLEDYMVCLHGIVWSGTAGNSVRIYVQEEEGSLKQVFHVTARVSETYMPNGHAPVTILNEKADGYYAFVLPWTKNRVWSYNKEKEWYDSCRYADEE